jgi:hypothetical protein
MTGRGRVTLCVSVWGGGVAAGWVAVGWRRRERGGGTCKTKQEWGLHDKVGGDLRIGHSSLFLAGWMKIDIKERW